MELKDFMDLKKLQDIQDKFSNATGLAAIAIGTHGEYLTNPSNFTDFCMKYTRGSIEGKRRCVKCDNECTGTYFCHAGLMDFSIDIVVEGEKVGAIIGGQVLPNEPNEAQFRKTAEELRINPDKYIEALRSVPISSEEKIRAAADLLGMVVNHLCNLEYFKYNYASKFDDLSSAIENSTTIIQTINANTKQLKSIAERQKMLSLNASIEAARSGDAGVGFAVVAKSMQDLSSHSSVIYNDIEKSVVAITNEIMKLK